MKKIAVLLGGKSAEREISLKTGYAVAGALINLGYEVAKIDTGEPFINKLKEFDPHLVFIALHGPFGEDGTMQGLLEILGYPYTGCGVLTSSITMNKIYTKRLLKEAGVPTPEFVVLKENIYLKNKEDSIYNLINTLDYPMVIKAPSQGSTIGIYFAKTKEDIYDMLPQAFSIEKEILIERFIKGREVTISIMGNDDPIILPSIEIVSHTGVYDYQAKYTKGLSDHIIPARLDPKVLATVNKLAAQSYKLLGCRGFARVDFMVEEDIKPYVLEINTIPGMTETSLFPDAAQNAGLSFEQLIQKLVDYALEPK
ncbi:MAG: D-alanine--D-alanine ligase [Bacillota bacterium]